MREFHAFISGRTKFGGIYPIWIIEGKPNEFMVLVLDHNGEWRDEDRKMDLEELYYRYGNEHYDKFYRSHADFKEDRVCTLIEVMDGAPSQL